MPPPPSRRYATPASEFGIAKPVNEWFDFAAAGSPQTGPSFSRGLDEADTRATQRELESIRLQRELQGEQAASDFLAQAAGQNPRGLMQMLADSPELLTSGAAPAIQDYVATRMAQQQEQQAKRNQFSSKVLAPSLMKSLPPAQQLQLSRKIDAGMSITDAFDELENESMQQTANAKMRQLALDAAKAGANPQDISAAMQSPDPELYLASLSGKKATGGGGRDDLIDRIAKVDGLLRTAQEESPDGGATVNAYASIRDTLIKQLQAQQLGIDVPAAAGAAAGGAAVPGAATVTPGAAGAGAATTEPKATTPAAATPAPPPLSPFETQQREKFAASSPAARTARLNTAWTEAKDESIKSLLPDSDVDPRRMISLAQAAILGKPVEGGSPQERQLATRMSQYAARANEGGMVQIGERPGTQATFGVPTPVEVTPGYALLREMGIDPEEDITIAEGGMLGGDKTMKAYEVMDLRLKEIAQPLVDSRKAARDAPSIPRETARGLIDEVEGAK